MGQLAAERALHFQRTFLASAGVLQERANPATNAKTAKKLTKRKPLIFTSKDSDMARTFRVLEKISPPKRKNRPTAPNTECVKREFPWGVLRS